MKLFARAPGVFTPGEIKQMRERLNREAPPGETGTDREARAAEILQRKRLERAIPSHKAEHGSASSIPG